MKKIQIILLAIFIVASFTAAIFGVIQEARIGIGGFNGAHYHLLIIPFLPLTGGLMIKLWKTNRSFLHTFILSWTISTLLFLAMAFLGMIHYRFDWQLEWLWFWLAMSITLFILEGIVHLIGKIQGK